METENCCTGCNRPDLPWAGRGTELPIAGAGKDEYLCGVE